MNRRRFLKSAAQATALSVLPGSILYASSKPIPVDVELILAVDMSSSVDKNEADLQFRGYADVFRDKNLTDAIKAGTLGQIACMLMIWSGRNEQFVKVPWMLLDGAKACNAFADQIDKVPRYAYMNTSISGALKFAQKQFNPMFEGTRQVIDVSGDGVNNDGDDPKVIREELIAAGVVINGLPILNPGSTLDLVGAPDQIEPNFEKNDTQPSSTDAAASRMGLEKYYSEHVIGGPLSFVIAAEGFDQVVHAVRKKLIREIANISGPLIEYV